MMVKSMSRKTVSFKQLLDYINKPSARGENAIFHNLATNVDRTGTLANEFWENFRYCPTRKNGVVLYHEILSFSKEDGDAVTPAILEDLGRKYLYMRASGALAYAKPHFETGNPHLHILISSNEIQSTKKLRVSKGSFRHIKRELEQYQLERYPFLTHSLCQHSKEEVKEKKKAVQRTPQEQEHIRRVGKGQNRKNEVAQMVDGLLSECYSQAEFVKALEKAGFRFYQRGNTPGIQETATGKKYRLKTLGLLQEYEAALVRWQRIPKRTQSIEGIRTQKVVHKWRDLNIADDVFDVVAAEPVETIPPRSEELQDVRRRKRRQGRERVLVKHL